MEITEEMKPLFLALFGAVHAATGLLDEAIEQSADYEDGHEVAVALRAVQKAHIAIIDEYMGFNPSEVILAGGPIYREGRELLRTPR